MNQRMVFMESLFDEAISLLKKHEPPDGYFVAFLGGKDSIVMYDLVKRSGVKYDAFFNFTTVDPPELRQFIREHYPEVTWLYPQKTMFQLIEKKGLPSSHRRWCCYFLKEYAGSDRIVITGIRKEESRKRARRNMFETSYSDKSKKLFHLILEWKSSVVWYYIKTLNLPYCSLYDEGWSRIGCIGCPMATKRELKLQFERYPLFRRAYVNSLQKNIDSRKSRGKNVYIKTAEEMLDWYISKKSIPKWLAEKEQTTLDF